MKVVLRDDVTNVGRKGDIKEVKRGYARNFLIPKGLAIHANKGVMAQATAMSKARQARSAKERDESRELATKIESTVVRVSAKVGAEGKLFGSVTAAEIVHAVSEQLGLELDRHAVRIDEPIRSLGEHLVVVHLHEEVNATAKIEVVEG